MTGQESRRATKQTHRTTAAAYRNNHSSHTFKQAQLRETSVDIWQLYTHLSSRLKGRMAEGQSAGLCAASSWPRQGTAFFTTAASPCGPKNAWCMLLSSCCQQRCHVAELQPTATCLPTAMRIIEAATKLPTCLASTTPHSSAEPAPNLARRMVLGTRASTCKNSSRVLAFERQH